MYKNQLNLKIAHLYPDFLQAYCDKANLVVFKKRAEERNIKIEIEEIKNEDKITSTSKYDFFYISGSNVEALKACHERIVQNASYLKIAADDDIPILAINCGYVLLGKSIQLDNSPLLQSVGIFDTSSHLSENILYKKIKGICSLINAPLVGLSSCRAISILQGDLKPFLECAKHNKEGAIYKNAIGTYITSPLLAHNPHFCDYLISKCLEVKYKCQIPLAKLTDDVEWYSYNYLLETK